MRWAFLLFVAACGGATSQTDSTGAGGAAESTASPLCIGSSTPSYVVQDQTHELFVDDGYVYTAMPTSIVRTPRAGGPSETVRDVTDAQLVGKDASALYYVSITPSASALFRLDLATKTQRKLADGPADSVVVLGDDVVYTSLEGLKRVPVAGGAATEFAPFPYATRLSDLQRGPDAFYVVGPDAIYTVPLAGGTPTAIVSGLHQPASLVLQGDRMYFLQTEQWESPGDIWSARLDGTDLQSVLPHAGGSSLAVDATSLYYTTDFTIMKASKTGGSPAALATGVPLEGPSNIAVYGGNVYWENAVNIAMTATAQHGIMTVCK